MDNTGRDRLYAPGMASAVTVLDSFLVSAYELPKESSRKVLKALKNFLENPTGVGLHLERLSAQAHDLWSIRVDDNYRIILCKPAHELPTVVFAGPHDVAYRFAERYRAPAGMSCTEISEPLVGSRNPEPAVRVDLDNLETLVKTRKYLPLAGVLLRNAGSQAHYRFSEIESLIGHDLPPAARKYRAWWANELGGAHSHATSWLGVGWKVERVDFAAQSVAFVRS